MGLRSYSFVHYEIERSLQLTTHVALCRGAQFVAGTWPLNLVRSAFRAAVGFRSDSAKTFGSLLATVSVKMDRDARIRLPCVVTHEALGSSMFICCCCPVIQITMSSNNKVKTHRVLRRVDLIALGEISSSRAQHRAKLGVFARLLWDPYLASKIQALCTQALSGARWLILRCKNHCSSRISRSCAAAFQSIVQILPGGTGLAYSATPKDRTAFRVATTVSTRHGLQSSG